MNNLDSIREKVINITKCLYFLRGIRFDESNPQKTLEMHADQIIFELIKEDFTEKSKECTKSLTKHSGGIAYNEITKKNSRALQYSKYYRNHLVQEFKENLNVSIPKFQYEKLEKNTYSKPYNLSDYDMTILDTMEKVGILKYIIDKRIVSVKKIPNFRLQDDFNDYRKYFTEIRNKIKNDSEYVKFSILLFTTELKYQLETVYRLASKLSEYNNSKLKSKLPDDFMTDSLVFNAVLQCDSFIKENSLILIKMQRIKLLTSENCKKKFSEYCQELIFSSLVKQLVLQYDDIKQTIKNATDSEIRCFIENHYNIWSILNEELTWSNKKEYYLRNIYDALINDIEPPKIK